MKKYAISLLTIGTAMAIIVVLGWAEYVEQRNFERMAKQAPPTEKWDYGGGRLTDAVAMALSGGIILAQVYAIRKMKMESQ